MVINYHTWWICFMRIQNQKIIYGFHGRKIVLYLTMRKVRHAFTITIYQDLSTRLTRTWDTFYLWCRFTKPSNELCLKRGGGGRIRKKIHIFFCFLLHFITEGFFRIESALILHSFFCFSRISFFFFIGLFFYAVYMCWL